jgi:hypothetical protein
MGQHLCGAAEPKNKGQVYDPSRSPAGSGGKRASFRRSRGSFAGKKGLAPQVAPQEIGEKLELLAKICATTKRLDLLRETGDYVRCEKATEELEKKPLDELQKIKQDIDRELAAAVARQDAQVTESSCKLNIHMSTADEARWLSTATKAPSKSETMFGTAYPSTKSPAAARAAPADTAMAASPSRAANSLQVVLEDPLVLLGPDIIYDRDSGVVGLQWDNTWARDPAGPRDECHRLQVRLSTRDKVRRELGLRFFGEPAALARSMPPRISSSYLFRDVGEAAQEGMAPAGGCNLLGRYDVCCVKTCADLDRKWSFLKGPKLDFWVAHAAAVNVGETVDAPDFFDFQKHENAATKALDGWKYIEAMGHIMDNIVSVCTKLQIKQMVFFPLGMGAFLRHLGRVDANFSRDEDMLRLRRALAARMVESWARLPQGLKVHLCLQFATDEAQRNADAFLRAIVASADFGHKGSSMKDRVVIIPEGDALNVASDLAVKSDRVLLVNGANRQLIGNHWFASKARTAIDENLHRRSWRLAALSYMLNGYDGEQGPAPLLRAADVTRRHRDTLAERVRQLGGTVVDLND